MTFAERAWDLIRRVPRGRVATYGQIAALLGRPRSARAVGRALRNCPHDVPWHRVVNAGGGISPRPRASSMLTQELRLAGEGVMLRRGRIPLRGFRWDGAAPRCRRVSKGRGAPRLPRTATSGRG
jgi:methylated-DNA-protein-cysteine methyltransferase-like protein